MNTNPNKLPTRRTTAEAELPTARIHASGARCLRQRVRLRAGWGPLGYDTPELGT